MDTSIIVGIIGATTTVLSPILVLFTKDYLNNRTYQSLKDRGVLGKWIGQSYQELHGEKIKYDMIFNIDAKGKKLIGKCFVKPANELHLDPLEFNLKGRLIKDRFLKIDYTNKFNSIIQFGVFLLEISSCGKEMNGCFAGFGYKSNQPISGKIKLSN